MDLHYGNHKLARARVAGIRGARGLGFFRLEVNVELNYTPRQDDPMLFPLLGTLHVNNQELGRLSAYGCEFFQTTPQDYPDSHVLYADLDHPRVQALEAIRNGGSLTFEVRIGGQVFSKQYGFCSLQIATESHSLNQSSWLEVLGQMGYRHAMLIEVPVTDDHKKSTGYLAAAEKEMRLGHYREAVGACRDALEALSLGLGDQDESDPEFSTLLANTRSKDKAARLRVLRRALKLMTHPARHVDEVAVRFDWDREDAASAIAMIAAVLRWQH